MHVGWVMTAWQLLELLGLVPSIRHAWPDSVVARHG
jgi:hypothetical protein